MMNKQTIKQFLVSLNAKNIQESSDWLTASCPLAPWTHEKGTDNHPSFGISINDTTPSHYNCWSCHHGGSLESLLLELIHRTKTDTETYFNFKEAYQLLDGEIVAGYKDSNWSEFEIAEQKDTFIAFPESYLESFKCALYFTQAGLYLYGRNLTDEDITYFNIRFDTSRQAVVFPFRDSEGKLAGMRGRYISATSKIRYHDYDWYTPSHGKVNNTKHIWFNEDRVDWEKTIVLVEGAFDAVAVSKHYKNVMSPLSTSMSFEKIDRLKQATKIVCFFDNDMAGDLAYQKIAKAIGGATLVQKITYPEGTPPKTDASDLSTEVVAELLSDYVILDKYTDTI